MEQQNPISELLNSDGCKEVAAGVGSKVRSHEPLSTSPSIYSDRLPKLENDMAEIWDGTMKEGLKKLQRLLVTRSKTSTEDLIH